LALEIGSPGRNFCIILFVFMTSAPDRIIQDFNKYVAPTYGRFPLVLERGEGPWLWDVDGRRYLDFSTGIAVSSLGHAHPAMVRAFSEQSEVLTHLSNLYYHEDQGHLARRLVEIVGAPGKIFFCNSGAEANECLYKLGRRHGNTHRNGAFEIITFIRSFHGRTLAGIAATGQDKVRVGFDPVTPGFVHATFNDVASVEAVISDKTCAILLESIQGEGGIHCVEPEFLRAMRKLADQYGLLLMVDEVQCGLGRAGGWCAWKALGAEDVVPDAVAWAKGIAGGYPLGAVWMSSKPCLDGMPLCDLLGPGSHGTTYGGGPLGCRVALAVLDSIRDEGLVENAMEIGQLLRDGIEQMASPLVREVRGAGLMIGIGLHAEAVAARWPDLASLSPARVVVDAAHAAGLLTVPSLPDCVRLLPPLNLTREEALQGLAILESILGSDAALTERKVLASVEG